VGKKKKKGDEGKKGGVEMIEIRRERRNEYWVFPWQKRKRAGKKPGTQRQRDGTEN